MKQSIKKIIYQKSGLGYLVDKMKKDITNSVSENFNSIVARELLKARLDERNFLSKESGNFSNEKYFGSHIIVSLTTYGKRVHEVYLTIETLMQQTLMPNKIILWLNKDHFSDENIPISLKKLQNRGLLIEYCKDVRSYTKIIPALIKYPDEVIITVDDDMLYPRNMVENLVNSYKQNPELIHFRRGHRMKFDDSGQLQNYINWYWDISDSNIDKLNFPTGVGGVLYPPQSLHKDTTNKELFLKLAPAADDVWLKAMAILQGTLSKKVFTHNMNKKEDYLINGGEDEIALFHSNITQNDVQLKAVFDHYNLFK